MSQSIKESVLERIDVNEVSKLTLDLVRIPSPRGHEEQVGNFIWEWMNKNGIPALKQEVSPGRNNVIGRLKGSGGGHSLIFNSHMDTGFGLPEDEWILGKPKVAFTEGWEEGDRLIGRSVINDKGPMAAFLVAAKAIKESKVSLKGDLILTAVIGEIGQAPVDEFQGDMYDGKGFGTRFLVNHGVIADYALVAEGTNFIVTRAEAGDVWFKISIYAKGGIYMPFLERPYKFEDDPNSIVKAVPVITAIEKWAYEYQEKNKFDFEDGTIVPKVNIGSIRSGLGVRPSQTPGICSLYVDVRLTPDADVGEVKEELSKVIASCNVEFSIEAYLYRRGHVGKHVEPLVDSIKKAHKSVLNEDPDLTKKKVPVPFTS
ncbi:MAG: M20/M25/M40 family metallo-hydrolase, partial [Nitrososphaerota archaeon]|nr:M20/M25/M40 family metallo-hydrolase [Nitrososphaerota archaeon]